MRQATSVRELILKARALGSVINLTDEAVPEYDLLSDGEKAFYDDVVSARREIVQEAIRRCDASQRFEHLWRHIGREPEEKLRFALKASVMMMTEAGLLRLGKATDTSDYMRFDPEFDALLNGRDGHDQFDLAVSWYVPYVWNTSLESRLAILRNQEVQVVLERFRILLPWIDLLGDVD